MTTHATFGSLWRATRRAVFVALCPALFAVAGADAATMRYVSTTGGHQPPFTNWLQAATSIQAAVDESSDGDTVLVAAGAYDAGGVAIVPGMTNRVAITGAVTVASVSGPRDTSILGRGPVGPGAVRCAYVAGGGVLAGFTLTDGSTLADGDVDKTRCGGGAWCKDGAISNCVIVGNSAQEDGGGVFAPAGSGLLAGCEIAGNSAASFGGGVLLRGGNTMRDCVLSGNTASSDGGGVYLQNGGLVSRCRVFGNNADHGAGIVCDGGGVVEHSRIVGNVATGDGGGVYLWIDGDELRNSLVVSNRAQCGGGVFCDGNALVVNSTVCRNNATSGGGAYCYDGGLIRNSIVRFNGASADGDNWAVDTVGSFLYCCTTPTNAIPGGTGCIAGDPRFVDTDAGDYHLFFDSPCIDAGSNAYAPAGEDPDGVARSMGVAVDIGCYEQARSPAIQPPGIVFPPPGVGAGGSGVVTCDTFSAWVVGTKGVNTLAARALPEGGWATNGILQVPGGTLWSNYVALPEQPVATNSQTYRCVDSDASEVSTNATAVTLIAYLELPHVAVTGAPSLVSSGVTTCMLAGTNNDAVVGDMWWTNYTGATGGIVTRAHSNRWEAAVDGLVLGDNRISVFGSNSASVVHADSVTVIRAGEHTGDSPVHYVSGIGAHDWPYTNWAAAATNIQAAVEAASANDTVLVGDGVYDSGGAVPDGATLPSRVTLLKSVTVTSLNGPGATAIVGSSDGGGPVRCVYLAGTARLAGFTIRGGSTLTSGGFLLDRSGGGVFMDNGGSLSNCVLHANTAGWFGGAVCIRDAGTVLNCVLHDNTASAGGGLYSGGGGTVAHCTLADNAATNGVGGGVLCGGGIYRNCIVYSNEATGGGVNWSGVVGGAFEYCCTTPIGGIPGGLGCIDASPVFVNPAAGNYRLSPGSPGVDDGIDGVSAIDMDGTLRPLDGDAAGGATSDMGAYECFHPGGDTDGDGATDGDELVAGTDPRDAGDVLRIVSFTLCGQMGAAIVWSSVSGRLYAVQFCTNPVNGGWDDVAAGIEAAGAATGYTNGAERTIPLLYRIAIDE